MSEHEQAESPSAGHSGGGGHKKKHIPHAHEEHEHEEGWIVSFADNVLLMMGFFVILLAINIKPSGGGSGEGESSGGPTAGLLDFAIAIREAFNNPVNLASTHPDDLPLIRRILEREGRGSGLHATVDGTSDGTQANPRPSDWVGQGAFVLFAANSAAVREDAKTILNQVAMEAAGSNLIIEVRGHASSVESKWDSNQGHDLAYARAWSVGLELVNRGLKWRQIRLVSCGDAAPVVPRARVAGEHVTNQRVEVVITTDIVPPDPYREPSP